MISLFSRTLLSWDLTVCNPENKILIKFHHHMTFDSCGLRNSRIKQMG